MRAGKDLLICCEKSAFPKSDCIVNGWFKTDSCGHPYKIVKLKMHNSLLKLEINANPTTFPTSLMSSDDLLTRPLTPAERAQIKDQIRLIQQQVEYRAAEQNRPGFFSTFFKYVGGG